MNLQGIWDWVTIGLLLVIICGMIMGAGCISGGKNLVRSALEKPMTEIPTPEPTPTPPPVIEMPISHAEPEGLYMARTNGHYLGNYFEWLRYNVTFEKDLHVKTMVYDYRFLDTLTEWWYEWGRYFTIYPEAGKKFLIIFPYMEMVGPNQTWDPRMYGMNQDHWFIQYGGELIRPDSNYELCTRIQELENTFEYNDAVRVQSFGYDWQGGRESCYNQHWLRWGKSNAWDGYIVYQVPVDAKPEDLKVVGNFESFGTAWWKL